ncbi:sigma-70 family RNA polymerase sigma factor [Fibrella sp. HMF5335]|uniref:Sigma-70 family RNA polymerase sigma factor n=1 Tax=Fibrella rubiginis TaxID=2817060 RepID=A0A939K223_9BACT|nr:sigma-70 family RNA polymerase sigma factor [Fibrella rubiginis]MBO0937762.1 sigma-70 family RNA polymerase sigma factor [Fibrella rubiginis]
MKHLSDEELVRLYVKTQRNPYFEALYTRYCDKVYRKCLSFTKNSERAEDFTHDIFIRIATKLSGFREQAKFSTWLYSVTYNYCMDQLRSPRQKEVYSDEPYEGVGMYDDDDAEVAEMEAQRLNKALDYLTSDERGLLMMKYQDDISIRDIAEAQKITESAVKMRLMRAKEKLRKRYLEALIFWVLVGIKALTGFK